MKITVIGAGLIGLTTAYFLQQKGHSVILIDRQKGPGLETSFANGGMLTPSQSAPWNSPETLRNIWKLLGIKHGPLKIHIGTLISSLPWCVEFIRNSSLERFLQNHKKNLQLAEYSLNQLIALRNELTLDYDLSDRGTLKIFRTKEEMTQEVKLCAALNGSDFEFKTIYKDEILSLEPALKAAIKNIYGGLYFLNDESGDAYKFCQGISNSFSSRVECLYDTDVIKLVRKNNEIRWIETSKGKLTSDIYILSSGSFSSQLAGFAGLHLPIQPVKGFSATLTLPESESHPKIPVIDESCHVAVTPFSNRFRIAGMAELCGYNKNIPMGRINILVEFFKQLYPQYADMVSSVEVVPWSGLRPYSCDGVPILGECEINNLYLNTGHGHLGWTMSVGSAKLVADLISEDKPALDLSAYHIGRF